MNFGIMRYFFMSLFFLIASFEGGAQSPIQVLKDTVLAQGTNVDVEIIGYNKIVNLTDDTLTVHWERVESNFINGWESSFCDAYSCFPTIVNSGAFSFHPRDTSRMDLHLYSLGNTGLGNAFVEISLDNGNQVLDTMHYYFEVREYTGSDEIMRKSNFDLYPNPVKDHFSLKNVEDIKRIEVLDSRGNMLKSFGKQNQSKYEIEDLPAGMYWIRIQFKRDLAPIFTPMIKM